MRRFILCLVAFILFPFWAKGEELPLPRFVSLRYNTVNMRTGPGERFPIAWVFHKKGLPLEVIDEFEYWRKVRQSDGTTGWIHKKQLTNNRTAFCNKEQMNIYKRPEQDSNIIAILKGKVLMKVVECEANNDFCKVNVNELYGHALKDDLYGIYKNEEIDS